MLYFGSSCLFLSSMFGCVSNFCATMRTKAKAKATFKSAEGAEHRLRSFGHGPDTNIHIGEECFIFLSSFPIPLSKHTLCQNNASQKTTMETSEYTDRQKFISKDGAPLTGIRSNPWIADTEERYVLWSDILRTFHGIDHLETEEEYEAERILFMIDDDGELYALLSRTNMQLIYSHLLRFTNRLQFAISAKLQVATFAHLSRSIQSVCRPLR